jgi:hypothetical protein
MQAPPFDTYCSHPDCVINGDSFFNYSTHNYHVLNHSEDIVAIHPMSLQKLLTTHR